MQRLGNAVVAATSQALPQSYKPNSRSLTADRLPVEIDPIDMLSRLITWRGTDGSIEITRSLTDAERQQLQMRADSLTPALEPFDRERPGDQDRIAGVAANMYSSFTSMRQDEAGGAARISSLMDSLKRQALPTWAIEKACREIQDQGFERTDGKRTWIERQWAPSDSEVAGLARKIMWRLHSAKISAAGILKADAARR